LIAIFVLAHKLLETIRFPQLIEIAMDNEKAPQAIPNFPADQFVVTMGAREITIIFGQSLKYVDQKTGQPNLTGIEWLSNCILSPISAQQLYNAIGLSLKSYEKNFGAIPVDPVAKPTLNDDAFSRK
jgi:hypothetical protein